MLVVEEVGHGAFPRPPPSLRCVAGSERGFVEDSPPSQAKVGTRRACMVVKRTVFSGHFREGMNRATRIVYFAFGPGALVSFVYAATVHQLSHRGAYRFCV